MKPSTKKTKIALIHNTIDNHIIPLYNLFADLPNVDLFVYFMTATGNSEERIAKLNGRFKYKVLPGFSFNLYIRDHFAYHSNPSIMWELIRNDYDIIVSFGYASITSQMAFLYAKICKKPFVLWFGKHG